MVEIRPGGGDGLALDRPGRHPVHGLLPDPGGLGHAGAGDQDRADVNKGLLQYFIVRQLGGGWYVNSAPSITVNWKTPPGQKWTVPFGGGIGKVAFLGRLPVNAQAGAYVNAVKPDIGPKWQLRVQVQFLFPTSLFGGKKKGGE